MGKRRKVNTEARAVRLASAAKPSQADSDVPLPDLGPLKPTPVYNTYCRFAAERQAVFFRRLERRPPPWTHDPVLRVHKFTNAYRASDRVSQYLIRNVIYRQDLPAAPAEVVFRMAAILSLQQQRTVANDYTVRFENRHYQLDKPIYPGERGGKVVIEVRLDGGMAIRFGEYYLKYHEIIPGSAAPGGSAPQTPRSLTPAGPTPGAAAEGPTAAQEAEPPGVQPTGGRSGRTSAEPYPPDGAPEDTKKGPDRPAADHPWRRGFRAKRKD